MYVCSVGLICKIFSVMESPVFGIQRKQHWQDIYGVAWTISVIFDKIERMVNDVQRNQNVANLTNVLQDMPQTEALVGTLLRSLSPVIFDVVDIITLKPVALVRDLLKSVRLNLFAIISFGNLALHVIVSPMDDAFPDTDCRRVQAARTALALRPEREHWCRVGAEKRKPRSRARD